MVRWAGLGLLALLPLGTLFGVMLLDSSETSNACQPTGSISIDPAIIPSDGSGKYDQEQLANAAQIMQAGKDLKLNTRDQTIGVMTAIGESTLRVLDYGDTVGPDSRGLFQQRDNGSWGSYEERMNPYASATNFFEVLAQVHGREEMTPTMVAHEVQRNADPYHYEKFWADAVNVVATLSDTDISAEITARGSLGGSQGCPGAPGQTNADGWASPSDGPITSPYGPRVHPIYNEVRFHYGTDFAAGCEAPIRSINEGVVTDRGFDSGGNGYLEIDHGGGIASRYLHMYDNGMFVNIGDKVKGGQHIADEGSSGQSTGCHLHFEIHVNGSTVDPVEYLKGVGINFG